MIAEYSKTKIIDIVAVTMEHREDLLKNKITQDVLAILRDVFEKCGHYDIVAALEDLLRVPK